MSKIEVGVGPSTRTRSAGCLTPSRRPLTIRPCSVLGALMEPVWVPGAFEVPLATKRLLDVGCVGVVTLGIIERGQTLHGQAMGDAVMAALIDLQLEYNRPIGLGIIDPVPIRHIEPRLVPHARAAIEAVVHMPNV